LQVNAAGQESPGPQSDEAFASPPHQPSMQHTSWRIVAP
jgi:hypothetical protein